MNKRFNKTECWSECWLAFKKGDMDAFHKIYVNFFDKLYAYGTKLTNDSAVLEDCIQELFLELYTKRKKLVEPDNLEFYLLKSLKLSIYQKHRKQSKIVNYELNEERNVDSGFEFVLEIIQKENESERNQRLSQLFKSLDSNQRELLFLKFYKNLSYKEIGHLLGIQPDSAKKQVYRIVKRLRSEFKGVSIELFLLLSRGK